VTYFKNFGTFYVSRELLRLETSDLEWRLAMKGTNEKYAKLGQSGGEVVTTYFLEFWDPPIYWELLKLETSNTLIKAYISSSSYRWLNLYNKTANIK